MTKPTSRKCSADMTAWVAGYHDQDLEKQSSCDHKWEEDCIYRGKPKHKDGVTYTKANKSIKFMVCEKCFKIGDEL